jgi:uncharacterized repeat protein (TIGR03803 family)
MFSPIKPLRLNSLTTTLHLNSGRLVRCFCFLFIFSFFLPTGNAADLRTLRDHVPPGVSNLHPLGRLSGATNLDLALGLPLRHREVLTNLLRDLYDPASPNYHHYLTPQQFADQFGPAQGDYAAVIAFARSHGLTVTGTHPNRTIVDVSGPVAAIESAFHLHLRTYRHPTENRVFYAPDAEPSLDSPVPVMRVNGLDNFDLPHPMDLRGHLWSQSASSNEADPGATPNATGSGPRGFFIGRDFRAAYAPGVALSGSGQMVGLFELDGYYPGDVLAYERLAGLPNVPLTNVLSDGINGFAGINNIEVVLDIDMAISVAPGLASVIVYEGRSSLPDDVLNRMATDDLARQLSSSWNYGTSVDATREQIFQQFAAQGQTMFQASGDDGAFNGVIPTPSDDPLLTIVGGTSLTTSSNGAWLSETTWPGSGGGISTRFSLPAWQQGLSTPSNHASVTMRNIPDVSCLADTLIWLIANNGQQASVGGTSAAAPLWAGFAALANQQAAAAGKPSIGFLNPTLNAIGQGAGYTAAFHDITTGNNTNPSSPSLFSATPGYDLCTGWGTPNGSNLITALVAPPDPLLITQPVGSSFVGAAAGPFTPTTQFCILATSGAAPVNWALSNTAPWLAVSPTNGVISSYLPATTVTFSLNSAATNLPPGGYVATIWFTNQNDSFVQRRQFTLSVITPPAIITQPSNQALPAGALALFTVTPATNAQLFFQWRKNGTNLSDGFNVSGSATGTLAIANISSDDIGSYSVIVSNALNSLISSNASLTILPVSPSGVTFSNLYSFTGGMDGANPNGLIQAANGLLYGTTQGGGSNSSGTIFQMPSGGAPSSLYSFTGGADGARPQDALLQGSNGSFYGTVFDGGATGNGTIFNFSTNSGFDLLVTLNITNGDLPYAGLCPGADGNFHGVTYQGGASGRGSVFTMTPAGQLTTIYSFTGGTDGGFPRGNLIQGVDGNFYGTTLQGGAFNDGTVFKITANGLLSTLFSFNGTNGGFPAAGLLQDEDGDLYGATSGGTNTPGTLFEITPAGLFTNLYMFTGGADGAQPLGGLLLGGDGNIYGTTAYGGAYGSGTVFRWGRAGGLTSLLQFYGLNGANPVATMTQGSDGFFYGATQNGGAGGAGVIFRLGFGGAPQITTQPANQAVFSGANAVFSVITSGAEPFSYRWAINGVNLSDGGNISGSHTRVLTISSASPADAAVYSVTVSNALGAVTSSGAALGVIISPPVITQQPTNQTLSPGATAIFSVSVSGTQPLTYQWQKNGVSLTDSPDIVGSATTMLTLNDVTEANNGVYSVLVGNPIASLPSQGATLAVVPVSSPGTTFNTLHSFAGGTDGYSPSGLTLGMDGNLYGTTQFGGPVHAGTVFRVSAGGVVSNLASFGAGTGFGPRGGVVEGLDGNFYGTTEFGGSDTGGNIYRMTPAGILSNIYSFSGGSDGYLPIAPLVRGSDGNFYGTTQYGGDFGLGNIFKVSTDGTFANLYSFTGGLDDSAPTNELMQAADGNFYGVTQHGGTLGLGSVFQLTPGGTFTTIYSFTGGTDGKFPNGPLAQGPDGALYGTTQHSTFHGFAFYGVVFKVTTGGAFTTLYMLNLNDGHYPAAGLFQDNNGNFFGTAEFGGQPGNGSVFSVAPGGAITNLVFFDGFDEGAHPETPLAQGADGALYGTTSTGGPGGRGNIFRLALTAVAPQINTAPASQTVFVGSTVNFQVGVLASPTLSYQWQFNGTNLTDGGNLSGSATRVLTITNALPANAGMYSVTVSNSLGSAVSPAAQLSVSLQPQLQMPVVTNGSFVFSWIAAPGESYQVQYLTNLASTNWINLGAPVTASNEFTISTNLLGPDQERFYRVLLLP